MKAQHFFVLKFCASLMVLSLVQSCAPPQITNKKAALSNSAELDKPQLPAEPLDYELIPTMQSPSVEKLPGIQYEKPLTEIRTEQTVLHLNQVKMSKVALTYNMEKRTLSVKGIAEVLDDSQRLLAESSFIISGESKNSNPVVTLAAATKEKVNSNLKPVIRAQATCLATTMNDEPDCSRVVVDFFIAYKQKIYTEQMEIKTTRPHVPKDKTLPVPTVPTPATEPATEPVAAPTAPAPEAAVNETSELQKEEPENSVPGRFEGQAEVVDLTEIFDKDDEIQAVLKPKAKAKTKAEAEEKIKETSEPQTPEKKDSKPAPKTDPKKDLKDEPKKELGPAVTPKPDSKSDAKPDTQPSITHDVGQTKSGDLRPKNQAIGYPNDGSLRNATSLLVTQKKLDKKSYFEIVFPQRQRYFATYEMAEMLTRLGERLYTQFDRNLAVSDISQAKGGLISSHLSHQIGMDADIAYPSTNDKVKFPVVVEMKSRRYNPNIYSVEKTYDILKFASQQEDIKIDRIFVDRVIKTSLCEYAKSKGELNGPDKIVVQQLFKSMQHINGHGDHFHLRLKCTPAHPGCRKQQYMEVSGCS